MKKFAFFNILLISMLFSLPKSVFAQPFPTWPVTATPTPTLSCQCIPMPFSGVCPPSVPVRCPDGNQCCTMGTCCTSGPTATPSPTPPMGSGCFLKTPTTPVCYSPYQQCPGNNYCCLDLAACPPPVISPPPPPSGPDPTCDSPLGGKGINTAIGCIPVENEGGLVQFILSWGIGIAGGVAFLLIIYAGFLIMTSSGDPKRLQAGKELLTAAIAGLVLLIFSVFILRLVGVEVLGIFQ